MAVPSKAGVSRADLGAFGIRGKAPAPVHNPTDGADVIILRRLGNQVRELFRRTLLPATALDDRALLPLNLDVSRPRRRRTRLPHGAPDRRGTRSSRLDLLWQGLNAEAEPPRIATAAMTEAPPASADCTPRPAPVVDRVPRSQAHSCSICRCALDGRGSFRQRPGCLPTSGTPRPSTCSARTGRVARSGRALEGQQRAPPGVDPVAGSRTR